ncbi:MAG: hypothetical protein RL556_132 [Actinomycetota bacterium]|jgi:hypothetical protein
MKKTIGLICIFTAILLAAPAHATSVEDDTLISNQMGNLGISTQNQQTILENIHAGILPLSENSTNTPVSTITSSDSSFAITTNYYADGSANQTKVALPANPLLRASVSGCKQAAYTGYTKYTSCSVYRATVLVTQSFLADFTIYGGINNDKVTKVASPAFTCLVGACSNLSLTIPDPSETSSHPANGSMQMIYTAFSGFASATYSLDLFVGSNKYWAVEG